MIGQKFGKWTVISEPYRKEKYWYISVRCDCGSTREKRQRALKNSLSCSKCKNKHQDLPVGTNFNSFTTTAFPFRDKNKQIIYPCICVCGKICNIEHSHLKNGKTKSCHNCAIKKVHQFNHERVNHLVLGKKFGKWTVVSEVHEPERERYMYHVVCDCGNKSLVTSTALLTKKSTHCLSCTSRIHGREGKTEYRIWDGMRRRCQNTNNKDYPRYGGRGIKVCERWQKFANFFEDMGLRPKGLQLDRIDNDGNYEPGNVKWSSPKENSNNRRPRELWKTK